MVFIIDGCSFLYAHTWSKSGIPICWRHLVTSKESSNPIFFLGKRPCFHHSCATWNEQTSNIKTMIGSAISDTGTREKHSYGAVGVLSRQLLRSPGCYNKMLSVYHPNFLPVVYISIENPISWRYFAITCLAWQVLDDSIYVFSLTGTELFII